MSGEILARSGNLRTVGVMKAREAKRRSIFHGHAYLIPRQPDTLDEDIYGDNADRPCASCACLANICLPGPRTMCSWHKATKCGRPQMNTTCNGGWLRQFLQHPLARLHRLVRVFVQGIDPLWMVNTDHIMKDVSQKHDFPPGRGDHQRRVA